MIMLMCIPYYYFIIILLVIFTTSYIHSSIHGLSIFIIFAT